MLSQRAVGSQTRCPKRLQPARSSSAASTPRRIGVCASLHHRPAAAAAFAPSLQSALTSNSSISSSRTSSSSPFAHTQHQRRRTAGVVAARGMGSEGPAAAPRIIAFDLDGTLWYPEMYMLSGGAPFRRGAVYDSAGERLRLLHDTLAIFTQLVTDPVFECTEVAWVSRTEYPEWAVPALKQFPIPIPEGSSTHYDHLRQGGRRPLTLFDVGAHSEIYPGSKVTHFKRIAKDSGVDLKDMLFFDNENWNCREVSQLGVVCVHTPRGMTDGVWREGLAKFAAARAGVSARSPRSSGGGGGSKRR